MSKHPSFGTELAVDYAGGTVFVAIAQAMDFSGPALVRGDTETTDHDSASGYNEYVPSTVEPGAITVAINWDPNDTGHVQGVGTGFIGDFEQNGCTLAAWRLTPPVCSGTAVWTFNGYANGFTLNAPLKGVLTADLSIKISGKPTLTIS